MEPLTYFSDRIHHRIETARRYRINPGLYADLFWRPCNLRILMVADSFLYFSDEDFGLSELISILKNESLGYARMTISVAHRDAPSDIRMGVGNAHIAKQTRNFKFDNAGHFNPDDYDQVWLFGAARSRDTANNGNWSNRLTDSELRALMQFMDSGKGVFATGDHEDLGAAMGGFLPRVRQMRRWFFPNPGPNGEGLAPPFDTSERLDTNREGHDAGYQFNDQSDDIPQPITPKLYATRVGPFFEATYPHPVLCGSKGRITVLPDHPHESQCTTAADPNASATLDGTTFTEFPNASGGGVRPLPEVIATSTVIGGHTTTGKSGVTVARSFGAISAYDGHRAAVGRVVCDATWHHFININLVGANGAAGIKALGFLASPTGQAVYERIKEYFINIALWISPPNKLKCMRNWGLFWVIHSEQLIEVFDPDKTLKTARLIDYLLIGRHARDAIGAFASQCQRLRWTWDFVLEEYEFLPFIDMGDPWRPVEPDRERERMMIDDLQATDLLNLEWIGDVALGGAVMALREKAFPIDQKRLDGFDEEGEKIARDGAARALKLAIPFVEKSLKHLGDSPRRLLEGGREAN